MPTIAEHLEVLQDFHRGRAAFDRPLVPSEVRRLGTDIGMPVPAPLGDVLAVVGGGGPILGGYRLLDRDGIARLKAEWDQIAEEMGEDGDQDIVAYLPDQVARKYWQVGWIPFLEEIGTGHGFALDTVPESKGTVGQIVNFGPDD